MAGSYPMPMLSLTSMPSPALITIRGDPTNPSNVKLICSDLTCGATGQSLIYVGYGADQITITGFAMSTTYPYPGNTNYGVHVERSKATLVTNTVTGFNIGLLMQSAAFVFIDGISMSGCSSGIIAYDTAAFSIYGSTGFTDNTISGLGSGSTAIGIQAGRVFFNTLTISNVQIGMTCASSGGWFWYGGVTQGSGVTTVWSCANHD